MSIRVQRSQGRQRQRRRGTKLDIYHQIDNRYRKIVLGDGLFPIKTPPLFIGKITYSPNHGNIP